MRIEEDAQAERHLAPRVDLRNQAYLDDKDQMEGTHVSTVSVMEPTDTLRNKDKIPILY